MLIKCPECELQASDKAIFCPHCGYPFQQDIKTRKPRNKNNKRRRLPNGFGQISEIKDRNLRNPFRAMVSVGKHPNGRPICMPLKPESYFPTYNDAYAALVEYNKNPYDLTPSITLMELYEKWSEEYFKTIAPSSKRVTTAAWAYCSVLYDMRVMDIRARHIKGCMEEGAVIVKGEERLPTPAIKMRIKSMFNIMLDYAVEFEIVDRNYAKTFNISNDIVKERDDSKVGHIPFTEDEMQVLWDNLDKKYVDVILIQCYSGWRPQELGLIKIENVDLEEWTFSGGIKTQAGINRTIPIHSKIKDLVKNKYQEAIALGSEYLINCTDTWAHRNRYFLTYDKYHTRFANIRDDLNLNSSHRAHDGRVHFVTSAKKYNVDEYAIKYIVGHTIADITEKVYTKRELDWLRAEMEKIK